MTRHRVSEDDVDQMLAMAQHHTEDPTPEFLTQISNQAVTALSGTANARPPVSGWILLREALGGWGGVGGVITATLAGVWIGFSPPTALPDLAGMITGQEASLSYDGWLGLDSLTIQEFDDG